MRHETRGLHRAYWPKEDLITHMAITETGNGWQVHGVSRSGRAVPPFINCHTLADALDFVRRYQEEIELAE